MLLINIFLVLFIPFLLGIFILSLLLKREAFSPYEKLALSFALGLGVLVVLMFLLGVSNIPLTFPNISLGVVFVVFLSGIFLFLKKRQFIISLKEFRFRRDFNWLEYLLLVIMGIKAAYLFFIALNKPLVDVDAIYQYTYFARGVFFHKTFLLQNLINALFDKPFFAYLSQAWVLLGINSPNDCVLKILTPVLFLCFLVIFYSILRRSFSRVASLFFTFLLSTFPFMAHHVTTAYADFPQTFYYSIATLYLFLFMRKFSANASENCWQNLLVSFLFLAISVWVKRAGIFLAGINIMVLILYLTLNRKSLSKKDWKPILQSAAIFAVLILPWLLYSQGSLVIGVFKSIFLGGAGGTAEAATSLSLLNRTEIVLSILLRKLLLYADWHLLWAVLLLAILFGYRRIVSTPLSFLLLILFMGIFSLFLQFRFGDSFSYILDGTLLDRLVMNQVPIALYFCAEIMIPVLTNQRRCSG